MLIYNSKSIQIHQYQVGQLQANCYFLVALPSLQTWIIDPGDEGDFLSEEIINLQLKPQKILLTHGHFDHIGGILPLKLNFETTISLATADNQIYHQAVSSSLYWQDISIDPPPPLDHPLLPLQQLKLNELTWEIIPTPGHTPGSICIYSKTEKIIFTGDTLFADGIGRTDFSYSSPSQMKKSLLLLSHLSPQTLIFPGHGEPTSLALTLPFLTV